MSCESISRLEVPRRRGIATRLSEAVHSGPMIITERLQDPYLISAACAEPVPRAPHEAIELHQPVFIRQLRPRSTMDRHGSDGRLNSRLKHARVGRGGR